MALAVTVEDEIPDAFFEDFAICPDSEDESDPEMVDWCLPVVSNDNEDDLPVIYLGSNGVIDQHLYVYFWDNNDDLSVASDDSSTIGFLPPLIEHLYGSVASSDDEDSMVSKPERSGEDDDMPELLVPYHDDVSLSDTDCTWMTDELMCSDNGWNDDENTLEGMPGLWCTDLDLDA